MKIVYLCVQQISRAGCRCFGSVAFAPFSRGHWASWPVAATPAQHISTRFIASGGIKKGTGKPVLTSVKRMPPLPSPKKVPVTLSSSASPLNTLPLASSCHSLLDVEEIIVAVMEVFLAYQKTCCDTAVAEKPGKIHNNKKRGGSVNVPFYPPVPMDYLEEHFQHLLLRLLPAGVASRDECTTKTVRLTGKCADAEKNRQHIASRIQCCGVFTLSSLKLRELHQEGESGVEGKKVVLRLRPGVRELAIEIANFLFSLEPENVDLRKAVPLSAIRRMSLTPVTAAFIRHELANDVRRLLLVYTREVFTLTKNGTMVRLQENSGGLKVGTIPGPSISNMTASPREQKQDLTSSDSLVRQTSVELTKPMEEKMLSNLLAVPFTVEEGNTVVHMGRRFIAPSAMEHYRLSQSLLPLLSFIPVIGTITDAEKPEHHSFSPLIRGINDGFVDFVAVRDRAVARYPHLGPLLVLNQGDVPQFCDGLVLSVLTSLGVEWRWGRSLPVQEGRQRQKQQRGTTNTGLLSEVGLLFFRRRVGKTTPDTTPVLIVKKKTRTRLLLIDLQVEHDVLVMPQCGKEWFKWSTHNYIDDDDDGHGHGDANEQVAVSDVVDVWEKAFFRVHALVYNELVGSITSAAVETPYVGAGVSSSNSALYTASESADSALAQHLLRYFTPRQHEQLHDTLLKGVQGCVSPLFQHEIETSVACLFFPFGRENVDNGEITKKCGGSRVCGGNGNGGLYSELLVFNKYVDGFYKNCLPQQLPLIRPRTVPEEPLLAFRKLLPAKLTLEVILCLYREQLRHASEIGLETDYDDKEVGECSGDSFMPFALIRQTLHPATRTYIRDNIGDMTMVSLLTACLPQYFRVPAIGAASSWSTIGLTREGRHLARKLEASFLTEDSPFLCRNQRHGCLFTDNTRQQLDAFLICCC